jgi:hypothetical protein
VFIFSEVLGIRLFPIPFPDRKVEGETWSVAERDVIHQSLGVRILLIVTISLQIHMFFDNKYLLQLRNGHE